jgi:hypothetical protein
MGCKLLWAHLAQLKHASWTGIHAVAFGRAAPRIDDWSQIFCIAAAPPTAGAGARLVPGGSTLTATAHWLLL